MSVNPILLRRICSSIGPKLSKLTNTAMWVWSMRNYRATVLGALQVQGLRQTYECSVLEMLSTVTSVKGVASPSLPMTAPTLLIKASTKCPAG